MKEWELFEQFLISNNAYEKFIDGLLNHKSRYYLVPFTSLKLYEFTRSAFIWRGTKEGYKFWKKLDEEWCELTKALDIANNKIQLHHPVLDKPKSS